MSKSIIPKNHQEGKGQEHPADLREALFNDGETGLAGQIQVSADEVIALRGILFDLDPELYQEGPIFSSVPSDPIEFYSAAVRPMLDRHPVLAKMEVRCSGRGLHGILRFDTPVDLAEEGKRQQWAGVVKVVQAALPIDPAQPGITATTRALGSINPKNGAQVTCLQKGQPVSEEEVLEVCRDMTEKPFETLLYILTGEKTIEPCPICRKEGSRLGASSKVGHCYGPCGKVRLDRLYDIAFAIEPSRKEGADHA